MSSGALRDRPRGARLIAIGAPAVAALALSLLVLAGGDEPDAELQLEADERVVAGTRLPLRARLYAGLSRVEGPALLGAPCRVELLGPHGAVLAESWLRPGLGPSLEGAIAVPRELRGRTTLRARATRAQERVEVERALEIVPEPAAPVAIAPEPRRLGALQSFAPGPIRPAPSGGEPPGALRVRVRGGACVPEQPCELLVHVGEPAAALQLRATPSATPDRASLAPSRPTAGVVALQLTVHGPEAIAELVATRDGAVVATRSIRLPLALAGARASAPAGLSRAGERPRVGLAGETTCIVDRFERGVLRESVTLRDCSGGAATPFALGAGISRLQLRSDPFGSEHAAAVTLYALREGESLADASGVLAASASSLDPEDALARSVRDAPAATHTDDERLAIARYLLALHDEGLFATPRAVSGLPRAQLERAALRERNRRLGLLVLALCAVALAALVAERGLTSSAEARALLAAAGSDRAAQRRQRARSLLTLVASVASLLLLFALVAVYVIVRGR